MRLTGLTGSAAKNLPKDFPYDAFPKRGATMLPDGGDHSRGE